MSLRIGGRALPAKTGISCNFGNGNYCMAYLSLINESGYRNKQIPITYDMFDAGYSIFSYDCSIGHEQFFDKIGGVSQRLEGSLELSCVFDAAPTEAIVFVVLCYFPSAVLIDTNRKFQLVDAHQMSSSAQLQNVSRSY